MASSSKTQAGVVCQMPLPGLPEILDLAQTYRHEVVPESDLSFRRHDQRLMLAFYLWQSDVLERDGGGPVYYPSEQLLEEVEEVLIATGDLSREVAEARRQWRAGKLEAEPL